MTGTSIFCPGPKGPVTAFLTGLRLFQIGGDRQGVQSAHMGKTLRRHGRGKHAAVGARAFCKAVTICSVVQLPRPVSLSGLGLGGTKTPKPGTAKPTSEPPRQRVRSGLPDRPPVCGSRRRRQGPRRGTCRARSAPYPLRSRCPATGRGA
jgi:hypothetical protein